LKVSVREKRQCTKAISAAVDLFECNDVSSFIPTVTVKGIK